MRLPRALPLKLSRMRIAVLHQSSPPPAVGRTIKPRKPGGYADSSADIAYTLSNPPLSLDVITPQANPDPKIDRDWSFPDSFEGISKALDRGANVLWCNTTLHSKHPLALVLPPSHASSTSSSGEGVGNEGVSSPEEMEEIGRRKELRKRLTRDKVRWVGQGCYETEKFEDKAWCNDWLRRQKGLAGWFPRSVVVGKEQWEDGDKVKKLSGIGLPVVIKPIRGRGGSFFHLYWYLFSHSTLESSLGIILSAP